MQELFGTTRIWYVCHQLKILPFIIHCFCVVWLVDISYNSIHAWDQLHRFFIEKYFPHSMKINHKDKLNNFVALPRESMNISWDRFCTFIKTCLNHLISKDSFKEYFYKGPDENGNVVLDTIVEWSNATALEKLTLEKACLMLKLHYISLLLIFMKRWRFWGKNMGWYWSMWVQI